MVTGDVQKNFIRICQRSRSFCNHTAAASCFGEQIRRV